MNNMKAKNFFFFHTTNVIFFRVKLRNSSCEQIVFWLVFYIYVNAYKQKNMTTNVKKL